MRLAATIMCLGLTIGGCSGGGDSSLTCRILSPSAGDTVSATVDVVVLIERETERVELLVDGQVVADSETGGATEFTLDWDTSNTENGEVDLVARAHSGDDSADSPAVSVVVENESSQLSCTITGPTDDELLSGDVEVEIALEGADQVELIIDGEVVDDQDVTGESSVSFTWDSTDVDDGTIELTARVTNGEDTLESDPVTVIVDNTAPEVAFGIEQMTLLEGDAEIPLEIDEDNLLSLTVTSSISGELLSSDQTEASFAWDTTTLEAHVHVLTLEATDLAGNTTTVELPVVVANNAQLLTQRELLYDPSAWVMIPDDYEPDTVEIDRRISVNQTVVSHEPDNIVRVITWITWDVEEQWNLEYSFGQGLCPHRGVAYGYAESDSGLTWIDLAWTEVPESQREAALVNVPEHPADAITYPYNADPLTCGAFFGHVRPLDAMDHLGGELLFQANYVLVYGAAE